MDNITIASANINGLKNKVSNLLSFIKNNNINIMAIQETHRFPTQLQNTLDNANLALYHNAPTSEDPLYTGTAFIVDKSLQFNIKHLPLIRNRAQMLILENDNILKEPLCLINIYAPQGVSAEKTNFFKSIYEEINPLNETLLLLGDFNNTLHKLDNKNQINTPSTDKKILMKTLLENNLKDLYRHLHPSTTIYTKESSTYGTRIDRIYGSKYLTDNIIAASHLDMNFSDHKKCPIVKIKLGVVHSKKQSKTNPKKSSWKLNVSILKEDDYKQKIEELAKNFLKNSTKFKDPLETWDLFKTKVKQTSISYSIKKQINNSAKFNEIQQKLTHASSEELREKLQSSLDSLIFNQNEGARIRAKVPFIEINEKPTKDFFHIECENQTKSVLSKLKLPNGSITSDPIQISKLVKSYYEELWSNEGNISHSLLKTIIEDCVTPTTSQQEYISPLIECKEIATALKTTKNEKSPGPDGIPYEFYKSFWNIIKHPLTEVYNNIYIQGSLTNSMKTALVTLIPKKGDKSELKNWRPISLLNSDYKLLSKVISARLKYKLVNLISPEQKCGIPNRRIEEVHLNIAAVLTDSMKNSKPVTILTIDQSKAFDKVNQTFLFEAMDSLNIDKHIITWAKILYKNCKSQIQINKILRTPPIEVHSGIRQGCPLSMLLYIIGAEILNQMAKKNNESVPYRLGSQKIRLQQYADDTSFILNSPTEITNIYKILETYEKISGLKVNKDKTEALATFGEDEKYIQLNHPEIKTKENIKILGLHFSKNMNPTPWTNTFLHVKSILKSHETRKLTILGKTTIINSLILPHILKTARIYPIPNHIKQKTESLIYRFTWKPNIVEQVKRSELQCSKSEGGVSALNIKAVESAALLERLVILSKKIENGINDFWIKHAKMELGYHIKNIDKNLYSNNEKHYMHPGKTYRSIIELLKKTPTDMDWTNSSFAELRKIFTPRQTNERKRNSKNIEILNSNKYFNNNEREVSLRLIHNGYLWGDWRRRVGYTSIIKERCNFCKGHKDNIMHIFDECEAILPIWKELDHAISLYSKNIHKITSKATFLLEIEDNIDNPINKKLISLTRTEIIMKKEYLELNDKYAQNLQKTIPEIMYKIKTKMKNFLLVYKEIVELISEISGSDLENLLRWANQV